MFVPLATTEVLDCAHPLEHQLLCIGQALDAGDVEPFYRVLGATKRTAR